MSSSVNLVPLARVQARRRTRRRSAWLTICSLSAALCTGGWGVQSAASGALGRLSQRVADLQAQRANGQRRQLENDTRRKELVEQLKTAVAARRPQPWPARFLRLASDAPDDVFLTSVSVSTTPEAAAARLTPPAAAPRAGVVPPPLAESQTVQLQGYARNHAALIQFFSLLQTLPGCKDVELVRAAQENPKNFIAFEFECRALEGSP